MMEKITRFDDKCVIVKIPIGILTRKSPYEATRRCWRASLSRARSLSGFAFSNGKKCEKTQFLSIFCLANSQWSP